MTGPTILVATDFSTGGKAALDLASSVARDRKGSLLIVHVQEIANPANAADSLYPRENNDAELLEKQLQTVGSEDPTIPVRRVLLKGDPSDAICDLAEKEGVQLIVIGTHGRRGILRLLMGSVAELVVRRAKCPVLVVKQPEV